MWTTGDLAAPGIALGYAVGRLGSLRGLLLGRADRRALGDRLHPHPIANEVVGTPLNVPLHPTQLYEAASGLVIFLLILAFERKGGPFAGRTFWGYILLLQGVSRFAIEYLRGDPRGFNAGFSTSRSGSRSCSCR